MDDPFCIVMAESAEAVADLDAMLAVNGVDGLYVGPRDLSYSLGCEPGPDDPVLRPVLEQIWAACAAAGKPVGVHAADGATARLYRDAGCTLITVTADVAAISRSAASEVRTARGARLRHGRRRRRCGRRRRAVMMRAEAVAPARLRAAAAHADCDVKRTRVTDSRRSRARS
jgi:hypothetical protein